MVRLTRTVVAICVESTKNSYIEKTRLSMIGNENLEG